MSDSASSLKAISLITRAAAMLSDDELDHLGHPRRTVVAIGTVAIALDAAAPDRDGVVRVAWGFPACEEAYNDLIKPWWSGAPGYSYYRDYIVETRAPHVMALCRQCDALMASMPYPHTPDEAASFLEDLGLEPKKMPLRPARVGDSYDIPHSYQDTVRCPYCGHSNEIDKFGWGDRRALCTVQLLRTGPGWARFFDETSNALAPAGLDALRAAFVSHAWPWAMGLKRALLGLLDGATYRDAAEPSETEEPDEAGEVGAGGPDPWKYEKDEKDEKDAEEGQDEPWP